MYVSTRNNVYLLKDNKYQKINMGSNVTILSINNIGKEIYFSIL